MELTFVVRVFKDLGIARFEVNFSPMSLAAEISSVASHIGEFRFFCTLDCYAVLHVIWPKHANPFIVPSTTIKTHLLNW